MKKSFLLIVLCVSAFIGVYAQKSDVEIKSQLAKVEEFKLKCSFIKETEIYKVGGDLRVFCKIFTDLKTGDKVGALEFHPSKFLKMVSNLSGIDALPLGYLDIDQVDDLILALETIISESKKTDKKVKYAISYTAPGGIDILAGPALPGLPADVVVFRKKWFKTDELGHQTCTYSEGTAGTTIAKLPELITSLKEALQIANKALGK